jgi:phage terminase Nu1 subunit (DNA packaging protein)
MESTISDLCRMTGFVYRTVRSRLDAAGIVAARTEGRSVFYDSVMALPAIYGRADEGELDLSRERALLAAEQRRKLELQNAVTEEKLIDVTEVHKEWTKYVAACRAKLLSLPTKLAPLVIATKDRKAAHDIIKRGVYEALNELADGKI